MFASRDFGPDLKIGDMQLFNSSEGLHYVVPIDWISGEPRVMEPDKCAGMIGEIF